MRYRLGALTKEDLDFLKKEIGLYLKSKKLDPNSEIYTHEEWAARGEKHGRDAMLTIVTEGPLGRLLNYGDRPGAEKELEDWNAYLESLGLWWELGFSWSIHLYPLDGPMLAGPGRRSLGAFGFEEGAGLLIARIDDWKVLLIKRSVDVPSPYHWAPPGGRLELGEERMKGAIREATEEIGDLPGMKILTDPYPHFSNPGFMFHTFFAVMDPGSSWTPRLNWEASEYGWFDPVKLPDPLLPGVREAVQAFLGLEGRRVPV